MAVVVFPYCVYLGLRSFLVSSFNPNLSSPQSSLKCFLNSIRSGLYERAYSLLTDQAQKAGRLKLPRKGVLWEKVPEIVIENLSSFKQFWTDMETFSWKAKTRKIQAKALDSHTTLLTVPVMLDNPSKKPQKLSFEAEFVLVKRQELWFLANGFLWPLYM